MSTFVWYIIPALVIVYVVWSRMGGRGIGSIAASDLQTRLKTDARSLQVIDVREPSEYKSGHIAQAVNIPLGQIGQQVSKLKQDGEIVFVCRSGARSMMAAKKAKSAGYTNVLNMTGGMSRWSGDVKK